MQSWPRSISTFCLHSFQNCKLDQLSLERVCFFQERREKWEFLLEEYYNIFVKELDGKEAPYTLEQVTLTMGSNR